MNCSKFSKSRTKDTCLTKKELIQVGREITHKNLQVMPKKDIITKLEKILGVSFSTHERQLFHYIKDPNLRFHLKYMLFKPRIKNILEGLKTSEISSIMYQATKKHPSFVYLGTFPADYIVKIPKNTEKQYGFIMNTKPNNHPGEHWCAFYISSNKVSFFDSNGDKPNKYHSLIYNSFPTREYNKIPYQNTDGLCGLYAINFLLCKIKDSSCQEYKDNRVKKIFQALF